MKQETTVKFVSEDKKMIIICDADTALGSLHDFLMSVKGNVVERIQKAQQEEVEAVEKVNKEKEKKSEPEEVVVEEVK